jgi:hypothetical protein
MGLFDSPTAPTPPNPTATAAAQTGTNVSTAIANSYLGNTNQVTPQGSLNFTTGDNFTYTDPTTGQTFSIPRWTATQTLTPQGQQTLEQQQQAQGNLAGIANQQSGAIQNLLGTPFNPTQGNPGNPGTWNAQAYLNANPDVAAAARNSGADPLTFALQHYQQFGQSEGRNALFGATGATAPAPAMGDMSRFNQIGNPQSSFSGGGPIGFGYGSGGDIASTFNPNTAGQIQTGYGPSDNFSADRQRVEQSMFERVNPQIQQDESRLRQQLADQGIRYGQSAYANAYDPFNKGVTDTRLGIVAAGGQEQQRMNQMAQQLAQFQNAAQQQGYAQQQGLANFWNQAQQQREGQNAARSAFYNQAQGQLFGQSAQQAGFYNQALAQQLGQASSIFNAQNQQRNQALQEAYQQRNQPINEISALLSGSQVQAPQFINAQRNTIPTTDVAGLINQNFAQQNDIFKTQTGTWNDIIGGVLGGAGRIGAAALTPTVSDVRVKENIAPMGSIYSPKGELPIYAYDYKDDFDDGQRHVGPMAQDVEKLEPKAVKKIGGVKHILPDKMGSIFGKVA